MPAVARARVGCGHATQRTVVIRDRRAWRSAASAMVGGTAIGGEFGPMAVGYGLLTALVRAVPRRRPRDPRARLGQTRGATRRARASIASPDAASSSRSALSQRLEADDRGRGRRSQIRRPRSAIADSDHAHRPVTTNERVTPRRSPPMTIEQPAGQVGLVELGGIVIGDRADALAGRAVLADIGGVIDRGRVRGRHQLAWRRRTPGSPCPAPTPTSGARPGRRRPPRRGRGRPGRS